MDLSIAVRWIIAIVFFAVGFTFWMTYYVFQGHLHNDKMKVRLLSMIFLIASIVTCKIAWQNSETGTEFLIAYFTHPFYLIGMIIGGIGLLL